MRKTPLLVWMTVVSPATFAAAAEIVWSIGEQNRNYTDLAFQGDVGAYLKQFPRDVDFIVGTSDPARDFSGIHPGPTDAWAGGRPHTFAITFHAAEAPSGIHELRLDFVDTHSIAPPVFRVKVNDETVEVRIPAGAGDFSLLRPEAGRPYTARFCFDGTKLRQGANRIEIANVEGSWVLYDAITLSRLPAGTLEVRAEPTVFLVEKDGKLLQEFNVQVVGAVTDDPVRVALRAGEAPLGEQAIGKPTLGIAAGAVLADAADTPRDLTASVTVGENRGEVTVKQTPVKKWRIYVAPAAHTDIGYTDLQRNVIARHNRNTDLAMEMCREFPLYHWNLESSWAAQVWFEANPTYRHRELIQAAKDRRVGIEASYLNMLTGLCSDEELIRQMYYSARLHRLHGVPFESYTLTDAPSHVWSVPSILAGAGLRCLSVGVNQTRAPLFKKNIHHKSPFWWEGPDGQRVLTWFSDGYAQASRIGLGEGVDRMRKAIEGDLAWYGSRKDYPFDAILLHGAYGDNVAIARNMGETLTEYSQRYAYPKVILCANNQFFEHIEKNFADKIQTVRGCGGSWWEDGAASTAWETAVCRRVHQDILAAEAIWAALSAIDDKVKVPQDRLNTVWDKVLLYDEHTWGAWNSIIDPKLDFVQRQWAYKAQYATDAADSTERLIRQGMTRLAAKVMGPDGSVLVFNPSGRPRTGVVEIDIPKGSVVCDAAGPLPQQTIGEDELLNRRVAFRATDVPAVGYRVYPVRKASGDLPAPPRTLANNVVENDHYKVTVDPKSGAIASIVDKKLGRELVDATSPYRFGQLVYAGAKDPKDPPVREMEWNCPDPARTAYTAASDGTAEQKASGPLFTELRLTSKHPMFHGIELSVRLHEHEPRIDLVCRVNKKTVYSLEAVYVAFPFAGANPKFRYEIGGGSVRPNEDHFPGACRDWFSVQRWVTVHTDACAAALSPLDTPLITLCDMTPGKWLDELPITNATVFAYVMNNYWATNYKASQDGEFTFRFSLTSGEAIDTAAASLFGESAQLAMRAVRLQPGRRGATLPAEAGWCRVEPETVTLTAFKPADDGKGLIVRLRETAGQATDATVTIRLPGITKATRCDLVERNTEPLPLADGKAAVRLIANGMTTIRLER